MARVTDGPSSRPPVGRSVPEGEATEEEIGVERRERSEADDEEPVLTVCIPEKAHKAYTREEALSRPLTEGGVPEDGELGHPVSPGATRARRKVGDEPEAMARAMTFSSLAITLIIVS